MPRPVPDRTFASGSSDGEARCAHVRTDAEAGRRTTSGISARLGSGLERELCHHRRTGIGDRDLLRQTAEFLVPRFDRVGPRREPTQLERAVFLRHREEWIALLRFAQHRLALRLLAMTIAFCHRKRSAAIHSFLSLRTK